MCLEKKKAFAAVRAGACVQRAGEGLSRRALGCWCALRAKLSCSRGQGTTEYAILVGVLVVIAILAISVFRPKLQELWDAIANGINAL